MSKLPATLASLLLIASSIGVNIARYPQVGRAIDAGQRSDSVESTDPGPTAQQSNLAEKVNPDSAAASETKIEPAKTSQAGTVPPAENKADVNHCNPQSSAGESSSRIESNVAIVDVRPMVPVANLPSAANSTDAPLSYDEVRRLPPVEPDAPVVPDAQGAGTGVTERYPVTATP